MGAGFGSGVEWAVRPFAERDDILQRYIDARPLPNQDDEANIRWGGKSDFGFGRNGWGVPTHTVNYPPTPPEDEEDEEEEEYVEEWVEEEREETEEIRIENPDDEEQYVMVKDARWIKFRRPDNTLVRLNFNPPSEG